MGLRNLKKELELQKTRKENGKAVEEDQFVVVMSGFMHVAEVAFNELEEQLQEAKKRVSPYKLNLTLYISNLHYLISHGKHT